MSDFDSELLSLADGKKGNGSRGGGDGSPKARKRSVNGGDHLGDTKRRKIEPSQKDDEAEEEEEDMEIDVESEDGDAPAPVSSTSKPATSSVVGTSQSLPPNPNHASSSQHSMPVTSKSTLPAPPIPPPHRLVTQSPPSSLPARPVTSSSSMLGSSKIGSSSALSNTAGSASATASGSGLGAGPLSGGVSLGMKMMAANSSSNAASASTLKAGVARKRHALPKKPGTVDPDQPPLKYPLEGRYIDEDDRDALENLPEIEREEIITARLEEQQKIIDNYNLKKMYERMGGKFEPALSPSYSGESTPTSDDADNDGAEPEKRATRSKGSSRTNAIAELAQRRKAKAEGKVERRKQASESADEQQSDLDDTIFSDDDEEEYKEPRRSNRARRDDYYTSDEEDEPVGNKSTDKRASSSAGSVSLEQLKGVLLRRGDLVEYRYRAFFSQFVKGAYVRGLVPSKDRVPKYRVYEVSDLDLPSEGRPRQPYPVSHLGKNVLENAKLVVHYGSATLKLGFAETSNQVFTQDELNRWRATMDNDHEELPSPSRLERKAKELKDLRERPVTEDEIKEKLRARQALGLSSGRHGALQRTRLEQERDLALRANDVKRAAEIEEQLKEIYRAEAEAEAAEVGTKPSDSLSALLSRVNEKNKRDGLDAAKRAHRADIERRKAIEEGQFHDPSARVKMKLKHHDASIPKALQQEADKAAINLAVPEQTDGAAEPEVVTTDKGDVAVAVDLGDF